MKVEIKPIINPVEIILETQDEIDLLFAIFNYRPIIEALNLKNTNWIEMCGQLPHSQECHKYHQMLCTNLRYGNNK